MKSHRQKVYNKCTIGKEKSMMFKKVLVRCGTVLLALCLLLSALVSCGKKSGKTLMSLTTEHGTYTISVNIYQLMLSRMKGTLSAGGQTVNGLSPSSDAFWEAIDTYDGTTLQTLDEYYQACILQNCRTYLGVMALFDEKGLTLSEEELADIDERLEELVKTDGGGSKTKLNSVLSVYGVNYNILKEAYTMEAKLSALQSYLYKQAGSNVKEDYLKQNYVHFYQVYLASYQYVYEQDENNDVIYYYTAGELKNHIYYDVYNGVTQEDENGELKKDKNGDVIYYVNDDTFTRIAYDKLNGSPVNVMTEDGKEFETKDMTKEELEALETKANELCAKLQGCTHEQFLEYIEREGEAGSDQTSEYSDGYYLQRGVDYSASGEDFSYLATIVEKLDSMNAGDVVLVPSSYGYHIIRKYEPTEKAYDMEENEAWFENFESSLSEKLLLELCAPYGDDIETNEKRRKEAPTMKQVQSNFYF